MEQIPPRQKQQDSIANIRVPNPFRRTDVPSLYRGPGLPPSSSGAIEPPERTDVELIFDSIRTIVMTVQGERLLEPEFGSRVRELVFEPIDAVFETKVYEYLTRAVRQFENRCKIIAVNFDYTDNEARVTYTLEMIQVGYTAEDTFKIPRLAS